MKITKATSMMPAITSPIRAENAAPIMLATKKMEISPIATHVGLNALFRLCR